MLSIVALAFYARCIYVQTVFQVFGVNAIAHFGLFIVSKLELKYALIETILDILLIIFALIGFGKIFEALAWYVSAYSVNGTAGNQTGFIFFIICIAGNIINVITEEGIFEVCSKRFLKKNILLLYLLSLVHVCLAFGIL